MNRRFNKELVDENTFIKHNHLLNKFFGEMAHPSELNDDNFPKYNILVKTSESNPKVIEEYIIQLALAGYKKEDLTVSENMENHAGNKFRILTIGCSNINNHEKENSEWSIRKKGISEKKFKTQFIIGHDDNIVSTDFKDGILNIHIISVEKEEYNYKSYDIN